tara:strand:+ start:1116 stop:1760 length:645 start_codon:yes stop_codon:yes gene_type:complete
MKKHALVIGGTGATGKEIIRLLINSSEFSKVTVFVRRKTQINDKKINEHIINFDNINKYKKLIIGDILFSCLGTTRAEAGSKRKQYIVDYTYQYEFAKIAATNGVKNYSLVSSIGANKNSFFFYPKIKGMLEEKIKNLNFQKIQIYQPPSLIRQPELSRKGERVTINVLNLINTFGLLKSLKPLKVRDLAKKMISESFKHKGIKIQVFNKKDLV